MFIGKAKCFKCLYSDAENMPKRIKFVISSAYEISYGFKKLILLTVFGACW